MLFPATMIQGYTHFVDVPIHWYFGGEEWEHQDEGGQGWVSTWYIAFSLEVDGAEPVLLSTITSNDFWDLPFLREYTATCLIPLPDLSLGGHELVLHVEIFAIYQWLHPAVAPIGIPYYEMHAAELTLESESFIVVVISGKPDCAFTFTPSGGTAPLFVQFTDLSTSPVEDVTWSYAWAFGDGGTSTLRDPSHTFQQAGTYTITLTVTTEYGSDSCSQTITVATAECFPQFTSCWTPSPVAVGESFSPRLRIRNQGSGGNIWVKAEVEGRFKTLVSSMYLGDYEEIDIEIDPHTVSWYLDYTPDEPMILYLRFWTGPVGENPGDPHTWYCDREVYVTVGPPPPPPPVEDKALLLVGAGLLIIGGGALILLGKGK